MVRASIGDCGVRALVLVSAFGAFGLVADDVAAQPAHSPDRAAPPLQRIQDTTGGSAESDTRRPDPAQEPPLAQRCPGRDPRQGGEAGQGGGDG
jgi:hypothetical protein